MAIRPVEAGYRPNPLAVRAPVDPSTDALDRTQGGAGRCRAKTGLSDIFLGNDTMGNTPNDLAEDFPGQADRIHELKTSNSHFARLVEEYNDLNRTIHRVETRIEPVAEDVEEDLKRRRVHLKDEIAAMVAGG
jgi:uncharacterized protein